MGAVNSLDLFGLDELIILLFYWSNRGRYRRMVDVGANLGLHTIMLARCGFEVASFEPDPQHFKLLERNLGLNGVVGVDLHNTAVSVEAGKRRSCACSGTPRAATWPAPRIPTGSANTSKTEAARPLFRWADLIKIDAEGHERAILLTTDAADWQGTEAIVEVGNEANAAATFEHFTRLGVGLFAQQKGWGRVERVGEMPTSHRQGSLFISLADRMPWPASP